MKPGTLVVVWRDNGEALLTRTRSEVERKQGRATVFIEGIASCYALDAVREVTIHPGLGGIPAVLERLAALENWAGRLLEFLDVFEGWMSEDDGLPNEAAAFQKEGLELGLVRIFPPKQCSGCRHWDCGSVCHSGVCECPDSPFYEQHRGKDEAACEQWGGA